MQPLDSLLTENAYFLSLIKIFHPKFALIQNIAENALIIYLKSSKSGKYLLFKRHVRLGADRGILWLIIKEDKNRRKLPNASRIVLASRICCSTQVLTLLVTEHKYWRMNLVFSVFPAPDSPLITHDWLHSVRLREAWAASANANTCGSRAPILLPW